MARNDILSAEGIRTFLCKPLSGCEIYVHGEIDSTNAECKRLALNGSGDFTIVIADRQTSGRGRLGRTFYSPSHTGLYMSLVLKPKADLSGAVLLTTASSVAVCKAIENVTSLSPSIKWINDIYLNGKKICGILTEAISDIESNAVDSVIVGIGINVSTAAGDFPKELQDVAGSLSASGKVNRCRLAAEIVNQLYLLYENLDAAVFIEDYKSRSMVLGQPVYYIKNNVKYCATATGITSTGGLIVRNEDNSTDILSSGEITLRLNRTEKTV